MNRNFLALLLVGTLSSVAFGQHSDIAFGYDDITNPMAIIIEQDNVTSEGIQFFESEFGRAFAADPLTTDDPGFETELTDDETLTFNPGDSVWLRVLNASTQSDFGQGYVNFYNPGSGTLEASGEIRVFEDFTSTTTDLLLNGTQILSGDNPQLIGIGDDSADDPGGVHEHLEFELTGEVVGAYGLLVQVDADFGNAGDGFDLSSDPFWLIINNGLSEDEFENRALPQFGVVPEPASAVILTAGVGAMFLRRRRKSC